MSSANNNIVLMGHGGGGTMTRSLIADLILKELGNPILEKLDDAACLSMPGVDITMSTDSYVIDPIFFPGGNIGTLAVCGTVNDLAMQGSEPRYLSFSLIIEEGFSLESLEIIVKSAGASAREAGVTIVTGDTKVVGRNQAKGPAGLFINTAGIGCRIDGVDVSVANARPGDVIILSGSMGDHGMAVMNSREGLGLESSLVSDVASLWDMVSKLLDSVVDIRCLRDPTRGGVSAALCDVAESSGVSIRLKEASLPVKNEVRGACDILGLDPLNVANEGKALIVCPYSSKEEAIDVLHSHPLGRDAVIIGRVDDGPAGSVILETSVGGERIVDIPTGENLPRIC